MEAVTILNKNYTSSSTKIAEIERRTSCLCPTQSEIDNKEEKITNNARINTITKSNINSNDTVMAKSSTEIILIGCIVTLWLVLGITINTINKWIFNEFNFKFPLFLASVQMVLSFCTNTVLLNLTPLKRFNTPTSWTMKKQIFILSMVFSSALAFGNIGLKYIYVSFHKMLYATTPAVTVFLTSAISGKLHCKGTYASLIPLCCGTMLCVFGEGNSFHWIGFMCTTVSVVLAGLKSILQGFLLKDGNISSISLLYHMSLPSFLFLALGSVSLERQLFTDFSFLSNGSLMVAILVSSLNGILYNLTTYSVTYYTSPITIRVLGNFNTVLNVAVSVLVFNHALSFLSVMGVIVTVLGVVLYQQSLKHQKLA